MVIHHQSMLWSEYGYSEYSGLHRDIVFIFIFTRKHLCLRTLNVGTSSWTGALYSTMNSIGTFLCPRTGNVSHLLPRSNPPCPSPLALILTHPGVILSHFEPLVISANKRDRKNLTCPVDSWQNSTQF